MDWAAVQMSPAFGFTVVGLVIVFGPLVAERLRLPGLLTFGAIIGPNMLDMLPRFSGLQAVGSIGVLYLIFLAGLQLDLEAFVPGVLTQLLCGVRAGGFDQLQDRVDRPPEEAVHRVPARREIPKRAQAMLVLTPSLHPHVRHAKREACRACGQPAATASSTRLSRAP